MFSASIFRLILPFTFLFCAVSGFSQSLSSNINAQGTSVSTRVLPPDGYTRLPLPENSYQKYLQNLQMDPAHKKVMIYNGNPKLYECYAGVINTDLNHSQDFIHGEHVAQYVRASYLYKELKYDMIHFTYDDGRRITFDQWGAGARFVPVNSTYYLDTIAAEDYGYESFQNYMYETFKNTSSHSLVMDSKVISQSSVDIGDIMVQPADPGIDGHAVMVLDMVVKPQTGEKLVLLAQGYSPTQDFHILSNPHDTSISPWYKLESNVPYFATAQWTFRKKHIRRFRINANALTSEFSSQENAEE